MLREYDRVRQEQGGFRRLFLDERVALYVWYEFHGGEPIGFQLTYLSGDEQKALSWSRKEGFLHATVDGWDSSHFNETPILVQDGAFDRESLFGYLESSLAETENEVRELVMGKIRTFGA